MLGDGHLGFAHGAKGGFPTGNALFAMTLKNFEYISMPCYPPFPSWVAGHKKGRAFVFCYLSQHNDP
jgi:hypothetical protein